MKGDSVSSNTNQLTTTVSPVRARDPRMVPRPRTRKSRYRKTPIDAEPTARMGGPGGQPAGARCGSWDLLSAAGRRKLLGDQF